MNHSLCIPVIALALLAGLLAAAGPAEEQPAPRPPALPDDIEAALDDMAREIASEEGRIDEARIKQLIAEAEVADEDVTARK